MQWLWSDFEVELEHTDVIEILAFEQHLYGLLGDGSEEVHWDLDRGDQLFIVLLNVNGIHVNVCLSGYLCHIRL